MINATLSGKPDAGNPHARFDEGEVASAQPRRGSLLYKIIENDPSWFRDPYDADFKKDFLMNISEEVRFDEMFPSHPLSEARQLVRMLSE